MDYARFGSCYVEGIAMLNSVLECLLISSSAPVIGAQWPHGQRTVCKIGIWIPRNGRKNESRSQSGSRQAMTNEATPHQTRQRRTFPAFDAVRRPRSRIPPPFAGPISPPPAADSCSGKNHESTLGRVAASRTSRLVTCQRQYPRDDMMLLVNRVREGL